jgi:hypothetical protein
VRRRREVPRDSQKESEEKEHFIRICSVVTSQTYGAVMDVPTIFFNAFILWNNETVVHFCDL